MQEVVHFEEIKRFAADIRIETIKAMTEAGYGHIGGAMSIADVLAVLYGAVMNVDPSNPTDPKRDYFVLSKGHAGPALYATLALKGYFSMETLKTLNKPRTILPSHCDRQKTPGVDMTTGSLGQGISSALGIALGNRLKGFDNYTYCILGDGELQEGQVWEGVQCAAHRKMDHFVVFVDYNKRQLDDAVDAICAPMNIAEKFEAFGFFSVTIEGHNVEAIYDAIQLAKETHDKPSAIVLDTFKGLGCPAAEKLTFNHYMTFNQSIADEAIAEIEYRLATGTSPKGGVTW
jgi:transketolase